MDLLRAGGIGRRGDWLALRWPRLGLPLAVLTWASALAVLGLGVWIAYAGGKVRHREFRNEPPPALTATSNAMASRKLENAALKGL